MKAGEMGKKGKKKKAGTVKKGRRYAAPLGRGASTTSRGKQKWKIELAERLRRRAPGPKGPKGRTVKQKKKKKKKAHTAKIEDPRRRSSISWDKLVRMDERFEKRKQPKGGPRAAASLRSAWRRVSGVPQPRPPPGMSKKAAAAAVAKLYEAQERIKALEEDAKRAAARRKRRAAARAAGRLPNTCPICLDEYDRTNCRQMVSVKGFSKKNMILNQGCGHCVCRKCLNESGKMALAATDKEAIKRFEEAEGSGDFSEAWKGAWQDVGLRCPLCRSLRPPWPEGCGMNDIFGHQHVFSL